MIDLSKYKLAKYPLFGSLYFSQGLIYALATVIVNIYLDSKGIPDSIIALIIGLAYLPWVVKFIFGWVVDYYIKFGRKKFIILGGMLSGICFIIISFIDPQTALIPFTIITVIGSSGIAFLDVAADAWAIELSEERERGKINGAMFGGLFIGMAVTSIVIGAIAEAYNYQIAFVISGLFVLCIIIFPLIVKETITIKRKEKIRKLLVSEFKKKELQLISLFMPLSAISFGILAIVIPQYMNDVLMLTIGQIGLIIAVAPIATVIGNVIGGFVSDKWGRKKTLFYFLGLNLFFAAMLVFADTWQKLVILWGIVGFLHGGHYSSFGALAMDVTNPKIGASQYSLMMAFGNAGEMGGTVSSGLLISILGFSRVFLYSGWIYGPALLVLHFIKEKIKFKDS